LCRKYNTTKKNKKQISVESLRADLHREINLTPICLIRHGSKLHEVKP
jgi:hypothetical protein